MEYYKTFFAGSRYGYRKYYKDKDHKIIHRENGPAIEWHDGDKEWWINDKRHRDNGPAIERLNGYKVWYKNGKLHREDGPAIDGGGLNINYYIYDVKYEEKEYWAIIKLGAFV